MVKIDVLSIILAFIAVIGTMSGPVLAYISARRREGSDALLSDLEAIKGWSEQRKAFEAEIKELHEALLEERDRRREERQAYQADLDAIHAELRDLRKKLDDCHSTE